MKPDRVLHVAALPFPSYQGTQTAIARMLATACHAGRDPQLLCYAARGRELAHAYAVHRVGDFPRVRSLRSGPSVGKMLLDARMAWNFERLRRRVRPALVVAHHVEAAALCLGRPRTLFFAHTDLGAELPSYVRRLPAAPIAALGAAVDWALSRRSAAVATISPWLAERFGRLVEPTRVRYVPTPWPLPAAIDADARARARAELGFAATQAVAVYAGNLDAYQSWPTLVEALARCLTMEAARAPQLLLVTQSDPSALWLSARAAGVASRVRVLSLDAPGARRTAYAASDVALVPRGTPGGLPIKLLDALGLGMPSVLMPAASAGLQLHGAAAIARDRSAAALAAELMDVLADSNRRRALAVHAREYIRVHHSAAAFLDAFDAIAAVALRS